MARLPGVDLLRGLSILAVVLLHISVFAHRGAIDIARGLPAWLRYLVFSNGGNGVSAFFVISGFLITLVSMRRFGSLARMQAGGFYRLRFARIAPLLLLLLAVLAILHLADVAYFRIPLRVCTLGRALLAALTFHLNWLEAARGYLPPCWSVLWSLSVEEMFYLAFPLACLALCRSSLGRSGFYALLIALIVIAPFERVAPSSSPVWQYQSYLGNIWIALVIAFSALLGWALARYFSEPLNRALRGAPQRHRSSPSTVPA